MENGKNGSTANRYKNQKSETKKQSLCLKRRWGGLNLQVNPSGSKIWIIDYINPITKKRSTKTIGHYPYVSLKEAREEREAFKESTKDKREFALKKNGYITFGEVAKLYFDKIIKEKSENYVSKEKGRYNAYLKSLAQTHIIDIKKNAHSNIKCNFT